MQHHEQKNSDGVTNPMERQEEYIAAVRHMLPGTQRYFIQTFGCQQNDHDSEWLAGQLERMGYVPALSWNEADFVLFNTCSIRENADQRFFGHLGRIKKRRAVQPNMLVAVCGCMMKIDEHVEKIKQSYPFVDMIFGPDDIYRLGELVYRRLSGSRRVYDIGSAELLQEGLPIVHERKFRALVTIMYGCNNFCSYCIVPYTRGRERSRSADAIVAEIRELAEQGFSEVLLLGQNVNSYGKDRLRAAKLADLTAAEGEQPGAAEQVDAAGLPPDENPDFAALLERICRETAIPRIRFMTSHPKDISLRLLDVMAAYPQIERHIHLPLQSGNDRILQKMNRHYTVEQYLKIVAAARARIPELALTTDIIVGFPGETEAEFEDTLKIFEQLSFDSAFMFQYSPRYGTPAALLDEQLPEEVMSARFKRLVELQNACSLKANEARVGRSYEVLIEGQSEHQAQRFTARASDFHLINFAISPELRRQFDLEGMDDAVLGEYLEGRFARVRITEAKTFSLVGEMEALL